MRYRRHAISAIGLGIALALFGCQAYQPAIEVICEAACDQRARCEPEEYAQQFPMDGECQLACGNDWLAARRDELPACERAWKDLFVCVADLSCLDLEIWRQADLEVDRNVPCRAAGLQAVQACAYECADDWDCRGWEECVQTTCQPRGCQDADDCPAGVWCVEGSCRPI